MYINKSNASQGIDNYHHSLKNVICKNIRKCFSSTIKASRPKHINDPSKSWLECINIPHDKPLLERTFSPIVKAKRPKYIKDPFKS